MYLRDAFYIPALVAARFNPDMRDRDNALIEHGEPKKVALKERTS
jgi:transposase